MEAERMRIANVVRRAQTLEYHESSGFPINRTLREVLRDIAQEIEGGGP